VTSSPCRRRWRNDQCRVRRRGPVSSEQKRRTCRHSKITEATPVIGAARSRYHCNRHQRTVPRPSKKCMAWSRTRRGASQKTAEAQPFMKSQVAVSRVFRIALAFYFHQRSRHDRKPFAAWSLCPSRVASVAAGHVELGLIPDSWRCSPVSATAQPHAGVPSAWRAHERWSRLFRACETPRPWTLRSRC
jgi:hypothetical protein